MLSLGTLECSEKADLLYQFPVTYQNLQTKVTNDWQSFRSLLHNRPLDAHANPLGDQNNRYDISMGIVSMFRKRLFFLDTSQNAIWTIHAVAPSPVLPQIIQLYNTTKGIMSLLRGIMPFETPHPSRVLTLLVLHSRATSSLAPTSPPSSPSSSASGPNSARTPARPRSSP